MRKDLICSGCGISYVSTSFGDKHFCANCSCCLALGEKNFKNISFSLPNVRFKVKKTDVQCVCCTRPSCAIEHDFRFDEERTRVSYPVCRNHFIRLNRRNLEKAAFFKIKEFAKDITFNIHDDFYHPLTGKAFQPK